MFIGVVLLWMVALVLWWDIRRGQFDWTLGMFLCVLAVLIATSISRFTISLLARPLALLEQGITSVREGRLEPIQVSPTGDEIQYLGESFNRMIGALGASQDEIRQHRELLEERIRQRTVELATAMQLAVDASQAVWEQGDVRVLSHGQLRVQHDDYSARFRECWHHRQYCSS